MVESVERKAFDRAVYEKWAAHFECSVTDLHRSGTELLPEKQFAQTQALHIWRIDRRAFVRLDPDLMLLVGRVLKELPPATALTADHLVAGLGSARIRQREDSLLWYLYPPEFAPHAAPSSLTIRQIIATDAGTLDDLKAACAPDEVEEGEVSVEDEIGFGCFDGPVLAAIATGFQLTGFMDIGVLTHPAHRRRGLGKAVVSALSTWCIAHEFIAQYRCRVANTGSYAIAQALHFHPYFEQQSLYLSSSP